MQTLGISSRIAAGVPAWHQSVPYGAGISSEFDAQPGLHSETAPGMPEASPALSPSSPSRIKVPRILTCIDGESDEMLSLVSGLVAAPLQLNVYYIRGVAFDEQGRVQRTAKSKLTSTRRFMKDVLGIYHVGLETHGAEYTFGNYHAKDPRRLGGDQSGVVSHTPQRAGPRFVLKESICLGTTAWTSAQVEEAAGQLGLKNFLASSYDKIGHNCVDFVRSLGGILGATELPLWCHRASSVARLLKEMGAAGQARLERAGVAASHALMPATSCMTPSVQPDEETLFSLHPIETLYEGAVANEDADLMNGCKRTGAGTVEDYKRRSDCFQADDGVEWSVMDDELSKMGISDSANIRQLMQSWHPPEESERNAMHVAI